MTKFHVDDVFTNAKNTTRVYILREGDEEKDYVVEVHENPCGTCLGVELLSQQELEKLIKVN